MKISRELQERFARQMSLPEIGVAGQRKLLSGKVLVVGAGGLGSPAAFYLVAAGVGTVGLMDHDRVCLSNLQRQILHATPDLGRLKTDSAADKLRAVNPGVNLILHPCRLTRKNAAKTLLSYDFVLDATDNFAAKKLIASACHAAQKPYSHAGISGYCGQLLTVHPGKTACLRCLYRKFQGKAPAQGPLGVVPGVIGTLQAAEAIKYLLAAGTPLTNALLVFDVLHMGFQKIALARDPACPLCGSRIPALRAGRRRGRGSA